MTPNESPQTTHNPSGPTVALYLLGTPRLLVHGSPQDLPYQKATALLAYLAVTARPHSRETLANLFWDDVEGRRARSSLRNALYVLRRELEPASPLHVTRQQVSLDMAQTWLDVDCFKQALQQGPTPASTNAPTTASIPTLTEALALWQGPFLEGLAVKGAADFNAWLDNVREQLGRYHRQGWLTLSRAWEKERNWGEALDAALKALAQDPLHEAGHRQVMRLHLQAGNRAAALQQYEQCRALLLEELGVVPDARTRALHERALAERLPGETFVAGRALAVNRHQERRVFVGRQQELAALNAHLRAVERESRGRLVLIEGEAGVGKTRLVREWLATLRHPHVLTGRCIEAERGIPYHPWIDLLRNSLQYIDWERLDLSGLWLADLSHLIPELRALYPNLPLPAPLDPELSRGRLAEAIRQWQKSLSQQRPLCLFLDDLQWIDRASLTVLEYVLRHGSALPVMVVGTQRELEADPHWQRAWSVLAREGLCHRLPLSRLSFSEVAAIARQVGFRAADPDAFLERLFQETEGNPLFVVEILRSLHRMDVDPSGQWPLPRTVKDVIQSHLDRLSARTRQLLTVAAVIGRTFDHNTLQAVTGQSLEVVLSALDEGIAAGLVVEQGNRCDFFHDKVRAVLWDDISAARRQHLHRRIAEALEALYVSDPSPYLGLLANHFEAAGEAALACHYALRAAKQAVELYADEDALSWYDRAHAFSEMAQTELNPKMIPQVIPFQQLYISTTLPLDVPGLLYRQRGLIHQRRGRYEMARQNFQLALSRAVERERWDEQAAAHGLLSYLAYLRGDYDELAERAQQSVDLAAQAGEVPLQAEGLRNLGIAAHRAGDYARAIELYEASLSASRSINDRSGMAKCHNNIGFALRTLQRFDEAVASFERALALHQATGSTEGVALVLANIGGVYARSEDMAQALTYLKRALALGETSHADWITVRACRTLAGVYLSDDQWPQALDSAQRARDLAEALGSKEDLGAAYRLLGEIAAAWPESGLGAANPYFEQSLALLRQVGEQYELTRTLSSLEAYEQTQA